MGNSRIISERLQPRTILCFSSKQSSNKNTHKVIALEDNPYYQKYAARINKLKVSNPEEYEKRIKALQNKYLEGTKTNNINKKTQYVESSKTESAPTLCEKGNELKLSSIMKVEKLHDKSSTEIELLWKNYYKSRDAVCAVMTPKQFDVLDALASLYPVFVYPIPRKDGYEMYIGQYSNNTFHFTTLIQYQKYQENSPIQFSIYHFKDFNDKGVILMSGDVIDDGVNVTDAQLLAYQVQYFYGEDNFKLVREFNTNATKFDVNNVIQELDNELILKAGRENTTR